MKTIVPPQERARALLELRRRGRGQALVRYQKDFLGFATEVLHIPLHRLRWSLNPKYGGHAWDGTVDPLVAAARALEEGRNVGIESGTGTGKSFWLAVVYLWFIACWEGARVFTFAPKEDQLRLYSWTELRKLWPLFKLHFPHAELTDLRIRMRPGSDEWGVFGYSVQIRAGEEVAGRAAGMHAEHMLLVYEEASFVELAVIEAGTQTCTAPHNIQIAVGNPNHQHDSLHAFCKRPDVEDIRISGLDHPNVVSGDPDIIPGAVSQESIDRRIAMGQSRDSRLYMSRVRGISPPEAADALIRQDWIDACVAKYNDPRYRVGLPGRGVDCANSENGDKAAIARGIGACLLEVVSFQCPRADLLGVRIAAEMALEGIDERHVGVDSVGIGASTVNKLKELNRLVQALNGGLTGAAIAGGIDEDLLREKGMGVLPEELFGNLRAKMYWLMRLDIQLGRVALPNDPELHADLTLITWETRNGKIYVVSKEELYETLKRSPDKGDAVAYWNYVRHRRALPAAEPEVSAWDPAVLEHEAKEGRRIRGPKAERRPIPVTAVEYIP